MAIIRYCGSEPKVNQCLKHLLLLVGYKQVFFYVFFFSIPSLHLVWIRNEHRKKMVLLCYCCAALGGPAEWGFCVSFACSDQQQSSPCCRRTGEGQGWAPRGYYAFLNQTNDRPIMRTVLCRPVCASINKPSVFSVEPQPNVYCSLYIHFFLKARSMSKASLHANENISMHALTPQRLWMHAEISQMNPNRYLPRGCLCSADSISFNMPSFVLVYMFQGYEFNISPLIVSDLYIFFFL